MGEAAHQQWLYKIRVVFSPLGELERRNGGGGASAMVIQNLE